MSNSDKKVVVGLSGGVDSAVSAYLLKQQGYQVIGLFMRNWHEKDDTGLCTAEEDYSDVKAICRVLDIPYYSVDFSKEYYDKVFKHFVEEYKKGRTPNPDVLCNKEIKFDSFYKFAMKIGADYVATGHYADVKEIDGKTYLCRSDDENKDQTYFLNQLTQEQIKKVIFPLARIKNKKNEVRKIAEDLNLPVAKKKDSTGICFIGERHFREFLSNYIPMKQGEIRTLDGKVIGKHDGVYFYTLAQRKGLGIGGIPGNNSNEPWFVAKKDVENNILYVCQGEQDILYSKSAECDKFNFITKKPKEKEFRVLARIRHRQPLQNATCYISDDNKSLKIVFDEKQRGVAEGQYLVIYQNEICLGGGVIDKKYQN